MITKKEFLSTYNMTEDDITQANITWDELMLIVEEYEKLEMSRISGFIDRQRGTGRPTKKERRQLDAFTDPLMFGWDDD